MIEPISIGINISKPLSNKLSKVKVNTNSLLFSKKILPILYINIQIKGKVKGFPIKVPINEAIILPLKTKAKAIANKK